MCFQPVVTLFSFFPTCEWVIKKKWKKEGKNKNEMKLTLIDYLIWAKYHPSQNSDESFGHDRALSTTYPGSKR